MKAITNHIIVELEKVESKSAGGILLSQQTVDFKTPKSGKVTSIGSTVKDIKVGDTVYWIPRSGYSYETETIEYVFLTEDDILATD